MMLDTRASTRCQEGMHRTRTINAMISYDTVTITPDNCRYYSTSSAGMPDSTRTRSPSWHRKEVTSRQTRRAPAWSTNVLRIFISKNPARAWQCDF